MCRISRRKKTEHVKRLIACMHDAVLLFKQEEKIQLEQIRKYTKNKRADKKNEEAIKWIKENASDFRKYLNEIENKAKEYRERLEEINSLFAEIDNVQQELN